MSQADIDSIRVWIADGAIDDTAPPAQAAIQVASVLPAPDATLASPPPNITVGFTKDLDPSTVNSLTLQLIGAGGDGLFSNGNEVTITAAGISVPVSNPRAAIFDLTGVTMNDDGYRFSILGTGGNLVLDMDGLALDGEYTNRFPSGDGAEGGDFEADFTVATPVTLEPNLQSIQELVFTPGCATSGCHRGVMPSVRSPHSKPSSKQVCAVQQDEP